MLRYPNALSKHSNLGASSFRISYPTFSVDMTAETPFKITTKIRYCTLIIIPVKEVSDNCICSLPIPIGSRNFFEMVVRSRYVVHTNAVLVIVIEKMNPKEGVQYRYLS